MVNSRYGAGLLAPLSLSGGIESAWWRWTPNILSYQLEKETYQLTDYLLLLLLFAWVMPGSPELHFQSTLKKSPPLLFLPCRKKLWCSFEIRELGRHDNSVGRAEYVRPIQWGTHCKEAFYTVLHSSPILAPRRIAYVWSDFYSTDNLSNFFIYFFLESKSRPSGYFNLTSQLSGKLTFTIILSHFYQ